MVLSVAMNSLVVKVLAHTNSSLEAALMASQSGSSCGRANANKLAAKEPPRVHKRVAEPKAKAGAGVDAKKSKCD